VFGIPSNGTCPSLLEVPVRYAYVGFFLDDCPGRSESILVWTETGFPDDVSNHVA
jgi:hypothetical protein